MRIGYARASTQDQNTESQIDSLIKAECHVIFEESESGTIRKRPELEKALSLLKKNDVLVVYKLDRLSRSTQDLLEISAKLLEFGADLLCTEQKTRSRELLI